MPQYTLPISLPPVYAEENFVVCDSNREAHRWIAAWPDWPAHALLLHGALGSGKTHLGRIWAAKSRAAVVTEASAPPLTSSLVLENIERMPERALLHLLNAAKESPHFLLLTSFLPPTQLPFALPDLMSRLKSLPAAFIDAPDDAALAASLRKQFADRQLKVEEDVIAWLMPRIERSFSAARETVELLDAAALAEKRDITVPFARQALGH